MFPSFIRRERILCCTELDAVTNNWFLIILCSSGRRDRCRACFWRKLTDQRAGDEELLERGTVGKVWLRKKRRKINWNWWKWQENQQENNLLHSNWWLLQSYVLGKYFGTTFARKVEKGQHLFENRERSGKAHQRTQDGGLQSWARNTR